MGKMGIRAIFHKIVFSMYWLGLGLASPRHSKFHACHVDIHKSDMCKMGMRAILHKVLFSLYWLGLGLASPRHGKFPTSHMDVCIYEGHIGNMGI